MINTDGDPPTGPLRIESPLHPGEKKATQAYFLLWQQGIRTLYNQVKVKYDCCDDIEAMKILNQALIRQPCFSSCISIDDLSFIKEILLGEREITVEDGMRLAQRFPDSTPLLDAFAELL